MRGVDHASATPELTAPARAELAEEESCEPRVADVAGVSLEHYLLLPSS
jgi:hypothetical protein